MTFCYRESNTKTIHGRGNMAIRILLAHSADLFLLGAQQVLKNYPDCEVLAAVTDFVELRDLTRSHMPNVILLGDALDPDLNVWQQIEYLRTTAPLTRIILLSNLISGALIQDFLLYGVTAILCKQDKLSTHLYFAVLAAYHNRPYLSPTVNTEYLIAIQSGQANLRMDDESRTVLSKLAQGDHIQQIALHLDVDVRRVYWVREKLRQRFGANTNEHLIQRAAAEGFIYSLE